MAMFETWLKSDLKKPVVVHQLDGNMFTADNQGNKVGVEVMDNGQAATLSGGVMGYIVRADNATVTVQGTLSGNKASIILPQSAYICPGRISIVIKVGSTTVGACTVCLYQSTTDTLVDPGHVIPSIEELLAKIADCEAATAAAMKVANMTVSAQAATGSTPDAILSEEGSGSSAHKHITFKLVPGQNGQNGQDGQDGVSPTITVTSITGGHRVSITDASGTQTFDVMDGNDGTNGTSAYVWIKWAAAQPTQDSDMKDTADAWIGIYSGTASTAPSTYTSYTWYQYRGADGQDGQDGSDGASAYVWIRYSATQPTQDSDMKTTADDWMGIYAGTASTAPTTYTSYTWYKIKGETGSASNVYGNTIPMSSTDSTKVSEAIAGKITEPATAGTNGQVLTSDGQGGSSWQTPSGGTVTDVQEDGTSILNNGVANIQTMTGASSGQAGTKGLVPAPAQGDQGKFLKGNGTWDTVPDPQDFTGATANANGTHGLVPAPSAGDQLKVLAGDGTWMVSPGSKAYEISGTVTNVSGAYSGTFNDDKVTADMKPMEIEIGTPSVFRGAINVQCYAGYITVTCSEVVGTSTIKVTVQKVIQDPTTMTSTEFDILNNRLLAVENVYVDRNISIAVSDWELVSGEYVYIWESSLVTTDCGITVYPLDGIENAQVEDWGAEKVTGGVEIVVPTLPVAAVPLKIRIINTKASQIVNLSGDDISTEAVTGADTVEEALEILDGKLGDVPSGTDVQTEISTLNSKFMQSSFSQPTNIINNMTVEAGGYIKIGNLVIVNCRFNVTTAIPASSSLCAFPEPATVPNNKAYIVCANNKNADMSIAYDGFLAGPTQINTGAFLIQTAYFCK